MNYQGKECEQLTFKLSPTIQINDLIAQLDKIDLPELSSGVQNAKYALLELINNALRAHREHHVNKPVIVSFKSEKSIVYIEIKDLGQGFNPKDLPYDFTSAPEQVDIRSPEFKAYQVKNNYKKFGVGLLLAKKIFPGFRLHFYDHEGRPAAWEAGKISGTIINLEIGASKDGT